MNYSADRYIFPINMYYNYDIPSAARLKFYHKVEIFMNKYWTYYEQIMNKMGIFSEIDIYIAQKINVESCNL